MPYLKINHDESLPTFETVELSENDFLKDCYRALNCQWIEVVNTLLPGIVLIIDENGKLKDGWRSRFNYVATQIYGSPWDCIVGDAILARRSDADLVPLTENDIKRLRSRFPY